MFCHTCLRIECDCEQVFIKKTFWLTANTVSVCLPGRVYGYRDYACQIHHIRSGILQTTVQTYQRFMSVETYTSLDKVSHWITVLLYNIAVTVDLLHPVGCCGEAICCLHPSEWHSPCPRRVCWWHPSAPQIDCQCWHFPSHRLHKALTEKYKISSFIQV